MVAATAAAAAAMNGGVVVDVVVLVVVVVVLVVDIVAVVEVVTVTVDCLHIFAALARVSDVLVHPPPPATLRLTWHLHLSSGYLQLYG